MSRLELRTQIVMRACLARMRSGTRNPPVHPRRVLLAHQLLLGDTLMTTALAAKLRARFPAADIAMVMPPALVPLYAGKPYGIRALAYSPHQPETAKALFADTGWDWALLPGDNRCSWLAQAMGAHWISGWQSDRPAHKNWLVDEALPWPEAPGALGDLWANMAQGPPCEYSRDHWPAPPCNAFARPAKPYAVLHIGASNPKKFWPAEHWQTVARGLKAHGLDVVLCAGHGEEALTQAVDPEGTLQSFAGRLDLAQLFALLREATVLIAPDTGVAHLGKVTGTPTVALFGQGPTAVYACGRFWAAMPFRAAVLDELPARPQSTLFRRPFAWLPDASTALPDRADIRRGSGAAFVLSQAIELMKESSPVT